VTAEQLYLVLIAALAALLLLLSGFLIGTRNRPRRGKPDAVPLPPGAEALAPAFAELRTQLGDVRGQIEELRRAGAAEEEWRRQQDEAREAIQRVERSLTQLGQLPTLQQSLQDQVANALRDLASIRELQSAERQRWERENAAFESLQRLTAVMLGSSTSGAAGERIVQEVLDTLPPQWRIAHHSVNGKDVEFAVRLPDGLILPIDSKVVAQSDLDTLDRERDPERRQRLQRDIQAKVLDKASEVRKYIDDRSAGFAIAAVPDAAYSISGPILSEAYQKHRALVLPYSLLAPFVLMVYEQHRHGGDLDAARAGRLLADAQQHLETAAQTLNTHLSDALTRLSNARDRLSRELAAATTALEQMRGAASEGDAVP
jgi:DNA recombination protein RmuC